LKNILILIFLVIIGLESMAQYPPPAGVEGTTAIFQDSNIFVSWAVSCQVARGYLDISEPDLGRVDFGEVVNAVGHADGIVVSLGDGGTAILEFPQGIDNGPGADFAIFENSFSDDFLELAQVYVSSNGLDYFPLPAISLSQTETQIEGFGHIDATKIHNLAGKYRMGYGTPFDLSEVETTNGETVEQVSFVKIIDVVGSIQEDYASYDYRGHIINDPWPTPFPSGGFDLDALGVIHQATDIQNIDPTTAVFNIYPNPNHGQFYLYVTDNSSIQSFEIINLQGQILYQSIISQQPTFITLALSKGSYLIKCHGMQRTYQKLFLVD